MEYKFVSKFDSSKKYTIETDEPLELYDDFALSIKKFDNTIKSFEYDNIDCVLKYTRKNTLELNKIDLDATNFDGYYVLVETFRDRECTSMGEGIKLIKEKKVNEFANTTLDNANEELKLAFGEYIQETKLMDTLFKVFLSGVSYGRKKEMKMRNSR